ncbi:MAG: 2-amino-4-hydroxy-6-hydroxymethyldihydropteridine diphosphokinase [Janthinobacterium lividum]
MNAPASQVYIGLGANLGDARGNIEAALLRLAALPGTRLQARSSLFCSAPIDADGDDYINAAARLTTTLAPLELLDALQEVEQAFGRQRPYPNAPRPLDLDILLYGQQNIASPRLTVPHPRLIQRAFALIPLLQLDPLLAIPGHGPAHQFAPQVAGQTIRKIAD